MTAEAVLVYLGALLGRFGALLDVNWALSSPLLPPFEEFWRPPDGPETAEYKIKVPLPPRTPSAFLYIYIYII